MLHDPDIDLRSRQDDITVHSTSSTTSMSNHVTVSSGTTEIWPFQCREMSIFRQVWTLVIDFPEGKSNIGLRRVVVQVALSLTHISFEFYAKVAEEIDLEMCSYGQLSEVQMLSDLHLDIGSDQGHTNIHSRCRTSSLSNHVTVAWRTTEIWPFASREIWTFGEVWTLVIAFLEGNSKILLRQAVVQSHNITTKHQFWPACKNGGGDRLRKVQFSQLQKLRDLDLDLRSGRGQTGAHMWSRSIHTPN